jgi:hypothetical protein
MAKFGKFLSTIMSDWLARMSGPLTVPFAFAALLLPSTSARILFAVLAIAAALLTCYRVWAKEFDRAETEREKNSGSRVTGTLSNGFLDFRYYKFNEPGKGWHTLESGCNVSVYISEAVNHNTAVAYFNPYRTAVIMTIEGKRFTGKYFRVTLGSSFKHPAIPWNFQMYDLFDTVRQGMAQGIPSAGFTGLFFEDFDRTSISSGQQTVTASIDIVIEDTLGKKHSMQADLELPVDAICLQADLVKS